MFKNVASQKLVVFAFDSTTNLPKTGDAANITAYESLNFGSVTVLTDTSATELSSTNAAGYYAFDLTQAETNADTIIFSAKSSTGNIVVIGVPATVYTTPPNFSTTAITVGGIISADIQTIKTNPVVNAGTVTFPTTATLASTTNITAGTITTTTNLTNAPTSGDFTATMKTSLNAATPASITGAVGSVTGNVGGNVTGSVGSVVAAVAITSNRKKASTATFEFTMSSSTTGADMPGLTVAGNISKDGGAFATTSNSVTEVGSGWYQIVLTGTEMTANNVALQFTATGATTRDISIQTQP